MSALPGLRYPRGVAPYPTRDEVVAYLERYVDRLGVDVEWQTRLERVERTSRGVRLSTSRGEIDTTHAVLATGPDRVPHLPRWRGARRFEREIRHASEFRRASDYEGRDVLVVGVGISGVELCGHLLRRRSGRLWVSARGGSTIIPRRLLGLPLQPLALLARHGSVRSQDRSADRIARIAFGDPARLGLPRPREGAYSRFLRDGAGPATDDGFVRGLREQRVRIVGEIESFDRDRVSLADGHTLQPDAVLCATGYRAGLDEWIGHLGVLDASGRPRVAGDSLPECPGLWFAGLRSAYHGNLHERGREARRIARAIQHDYREERHAA